VFSIVIGLTFHKECRTSPPNDDRCICFGSRPVGEGANLAARIGARFWFQTRRRTILYFAYTARIEPSKMGEVAPGAEFQFIAHLPQWGLDFSIDGNGWNGTLPNVHPDEGSTVWGAVFKVPDRQAAALHAVEQAEGRRASTVEAMDRMGKRHQVTTHLSVGGDGGNDSVPSPEYLRLMLSGSRHWSLPAGWIAGLEEHLDGPR
jgi:gamma-glutamylcyclotransferase (GGCT)/AIG2-like uncharacterized protein YtfP